MGQELGETGKNFTTLCKVHRGGYHYGGVREAGVHGMGSKLSARRAFHLLKKLMANAPNLSKVYEQTCLQDDHFSMSG